MPHLRQTPKEISEENQEIYEVVEKVREAYRDMGVSFSGEAPEGEDLQGLEDVDEVKKEKESKIYSTKTSPPVSWSSSSDRKVALAKRALPVVAKGKLMREYDISIEVENLSNGINELTTQVYKNKGVFITSVGGDNIPGEQADKKQMIFKIPTANHYRFMWNLERVGIIKKIIPGGGVKRGTDGFIMIRLMVNVIPGK